MNVLVTGGAGFIGRWVVKKLLEKGYIVYVIDDLSNGREENIKEYKDNIKFIKEDIKNLSAMEELFKTKFEYCYHLAASINVQESIDNPRKIFENDTIGTFNILEACKAQGCKIIFMSTCMVYDRAFNDSGISEEHKVKPASPYAGSKIAAENMVLSYFYAYNFPITIVRPFNTYGPFQKTGGEGGVIAIFIKNMLNNKPLSIYGSGEQTRDFLYVEDCADFIITAGENGKSNGQIINAGLGKDISINDLAKLISKNSEQNPPPSIKHVNHIHEQSEIMRLLCNFDKAKNLLGWSPKHSLKQGIDKTIDWIKQNQALI